MRLSSFGIIGLFTLSAFFLFIACQDRLKENKETPGNHSAGREPSVKNVIDTKLSTDQAEPIQGSFQETINIGLIVSTQLSKSELALAANHGAELAINQANRAGGYNHKDFKLLVRSCDGPWGAAAKEAVSLITDFNIKAILTSLDGRNAHLIEQVATKAKVMILSTRATDPTLSQAFVPWYFRCLPDDNQLALVLANELVNIRKCGRLIIVSENNYDGRMASGSFIKQLKKMEVQIPNLLFYDQLNPEFDNLIKQIVETGIQNLVVFGGPENSLRLFKAINETEKNFYIYGTFTIMGENNTMKEFWEYAENMVLISSDFWFTTKGKKFQDVFRETYNYQPGSVAAYAYDGVGLIIEAIRKSGLEREAIIESMKEIRYEGVTGSIEFDANGNRNDMPIVLKISSNVPVAIESNTQVLPQSGQ